MTRRSVSRFRSAFAFLIVAGCVAAGCSPTQPSGSPAAASAAEVPALVLGCLSIDRGECELIAERVRAQLPPARGAPFTIQVQLYGCTNDVPCPRTLAARDGVVTIEYADRQEPIMVSVAGPPDAPTFGEWPIGWVGVSEPTSPRVGGPGPFPFELGHCGLTWQVDFDGSFWVPIGLVDGDASPTINNDSGQIRLLGLNVAEYRSDTGFTAQLARFPGPKHVGLCD